MLEMTMSAPAARNVRTLAGRLAYPITRIPADCAPSMSDSESPTRTHRLGRLAEGSHGPQDRFGVGLLGAATR